MLLAKKKVIHFKTSYIKGCCTNFTGQTSFQRTLTLGKFSTKHFYQRISSKLILQSRIGYSRYVLRSSGIPFAHKAGARFSFSSALASRFLFHPFARTIYEGMSSPIKDRYTSTRLRSIERYERNALYRDQVSAVRWLKLICAYRYNTILIHVTEESDPFLNRYEIQPIIVSKGREAKIKRQREREADRQIERSYWSSRAGSLRTK